MVNRHSKCYSTSLVLRKYKSKPWHGVILCRQGDTHPYNPSTQAAKEEFKIKVLITYVVSLLISFWDRILSCLPYVDLWGSSVFQGRNNIFFWIIWGWGLSGQTSTGPTPGFVGNAREEHSKGESLGNSDHSPTHRLCFQPFRINTRQALKDKRRRNELVSSEARTLLLSPALSTTGVPALVVWMRMAPQPPMFE